MTTKLVKRQIGQRQQQNGNGHRDRSLSSKGCLHYGMRAVTPDEVASLEERKVKPFICDDCTSEILGQQRFTHAQVLNMLLHERRQQQEGAA